MLKIVRVLRLNRIIMFLNAREYIKLYLKLMKTIFYLIIYLHICGCAWFFIVEQDEVWIPPLDNSFLPTHLYEYSITKKYLMAAYHSVLILTGNDLGPRSIGQLIFVSLFITVGALINAVLFSELANIVQLLNK